MRYASRLQMFGLPLLSVAVGPDLASHQARGLARGIIAVGDMRRYRPGGGTTRSRGRPSRKSWIFSTARSTPLSMTSRVMPPLWGGEHQLGEGEERIAGGNRLLVEDIEGGAGQALVAHRVDQSLLVHQPAARSVDEKGRRLHQGQPLLAQIALRVGAQSQVQADDVGFAQELLHGHVLRAER